MEWPDRGLEELELYLAGSEVVQAMTHSMGGGGHPGSFIAVLIGGVGVLVKQETATPEAGRMVRREAAAWTVARALGWTDLVAATVLREVATPGTGELALSSVQILWPASRAGVPEDSFPADDVWRAGVFDAATHAADRSAANWLGVPGEAGAGQQRLKLVDHGHTFDPAGSVQSPFYQRHKGETIPEEHLGALDALRPMAGKLEDLLEESELDAFEERTNKLREGVLDI